MDQIVDVAMGPHMERLSLEEAFVLLEEVMQSIDDAGWERIVSDTSSFPTFDELRVRYADPKASSSSRRSYVQSWSLEDTEIDLNIKRSRPAGHPASTSRGIYHDEFIVRVSISNSELMRKQLNRNIGNYAKRVNKHNDVYR